MAYSVGIPPLKDPSSEALARRFQAQPWYIRLWRCRHLLPVPALAAYDYVRYKLRETELGERPWGLVWDVRVGMAHVAMRWWYTGEEIEEKMKGDIRPGVGVADDEHL